MSIIYKNKYIRIETEESEIPWLKIFAQADYKEMTDCDLETKQQIWSLLDLIETEMLGYFKPDKINIASFANYVPQVHWHIMARFKNDSYYPECMWGKKQQEGTATFASMDGFISQLLSKID
ncbi:MAG: diadenosine tetraphosphate (Ap4A) HIT family hydrolase [Cocleimonas sp.]|jgi:diadenosine tetraphosphate (Ap4A) HIT family hydrolase